MRKDRSVSIVVFGHQGIVRESLAHLLSTQPGVAHVTQHSEPAGAIDAHQRAPSGVILANHDPAWDQPIEALVALAGRKGCAGRVLVLTTGVEPGVAARLVQQGVGGLCLKHHPLERLMEAVRVLAEGETWFDAPYSRIAARRLDRDAEARRSEFTDRELLALRWVIECHSNKEIGARLGASESAAKGLLQRLFRKTNVRSRGQLIRLALEKYRDLL